MPNSPKVSIIVPCRNERDFIDTFLSSVFCQKAGDITYEIIIADGMSDDGTRETLGQIEDPRLRVISNPERTTPAALNHAIHAAHGEIIIRLDVHTEYADDYVAKCVSVLESTGADNVGGAWHASGKNYLQKAIALAFQSPFSSGGAGSHALAYEGEVDSVYLGCWKKSTLEGIGLFDEELVRNQDDELNLRITRSGGKVWQSPLIKSLYYPRSSLLALFKQYMQYGYWKVRVIQKHRLPASVRHIVPGCFVATLALLVPLAFLFTPARIALYCLSGSYALAIILASIAACRHRDRVRYLPVMPLVFAAYHFGYGYGFLRGAVDFLLLKKADRRPFTEITRG